MTIFPPSAKFTGEVTDRREDSLQPKLELRGISKAFGVGVDAIIALDSIQIEVPKNSFVSLLGPSGCGKSSLFNIIAGLTRPTSGEVFLDGRSITGRVGLIGYMLQKDLLLPFRTVLENIVLGMEIRGVSKKSARERALPLMARYGLGGFENKYPPSLSGGMKQRAALLRTLLCDTDTVLLDEPFGALDAQTRVLMQDWLLSLWNDFSKTVVFVTHDVDEAIYLSDTIYVLSPRPGRVHERVDVNLARPRRRSIEDTAEFALLRRRCRALLGYEKDVPHVD